MTNHELTEIIFGAERGRGVQHKLALLGLQPARWQQHISGAQRGVNVVSCEAARGQRTTVDPKSHGVVPVANQLHARDARNGPEPVNEIALCVIC